MATMTISIPDDKVQRVLDAFAATYGYTGAGGQSKANFAKEKIRDHIKQVVVTYEANRDADAALEETREQTEADMGGVAVT